LSHLEQIFFPNHKPKYTALRRGEGIVADSSARLSLISLLSMSHVRGAYAPVELVILLS